MSSVLESTNLGTIAMEGRDNFFVLPLSPLYWNYNEADLFLNPNGPKPQSPMTLPINSPPWCTSLPGQSGLNSCHMLGFNCQPSYDMPSVPELDSTPHMYPSPARMEEGPAAAPALQPAQTTKPAAKRESKNPYKNAPPSVISVRQWNKQDSFSKATFRLEILRS